MTGDYKISLAQRYVDAFGLVVRNTVPRLAEVGIGLGSVYVGELVETYEGDPVLDQITMRVIDDSDPEDPQQLEQVLEVPAVIRYSREKLVNETILNRDFVEGIEPGMVVESSGWSPWNLMIQGFLINSNNHLEAPLNQLADFQDFLRHHKIYDIISDVTNAIDVGQVTIRNKSFSQMANWPDTISFTLTIKSHVSPEALILT